MKKIERKDIWLFLAQLGVWTLVLLLPSLIVLLSTRDWHSAFQTARMSFFMLQSPLLLYFVNFYLLHRLFFSRRYGWFVLLNVLLLLFFNFGFIYGWRFIPDMPRVAWIGYYTGMFIYFLLNCTIIAIALGIRHFIRTNRMKQQLLSERAKRTEAELAWLKHQINPHFLFNTLNNISSLTQINADEAQDAIGQLSDLLRYAIYETEKEFVPLKGEVAFMRNYIALMKLRYTDRTVVDYNVDVTDEDLLVAPLLFVSLVENAFKHGTSNRGASRIGISLFQEGGDLVFVCENTNHPKSDTDRSGSGIGVENTRRRLELIYPERYKWEQWLNDDIYHVKVRLKVKDSSVTRT